MLGLVGGAPGGETRESPDLVDVMVLGLVGGAPGGETPRVADSSAAGAGRFFHNSVPPSKLNRLGKPPRTMCNVRPFNQLVPRLPAGDQCNYELAVEDTSEQNPWQAAALAGKRQYKYV